MEIKVLCGCGSKFKFEVEPVNGQMPCRIRCPTCGTDATTAANEIIQERLTAERRSASPTPPETTPAPVAITSPTSNRPATSPPLAATAAVTPTASPQPQVSQPSGRSNPPVAPERARVAEPPAKVVTPAGPRPASRREPAVVQTSGPARKSRISWLTMLGIALVLLMIAGAVGWKWYRHKDRVMTETQAVSVASVEPEREQHVWADDSVVLIIRHTSETDIAQACVDFWQDRLKKRLTLVATNELFAEENQIGVLPLNRGFVEIMGGLAWPKPQAEDLTQYLSQRFNTLAVVTRDVDFSGAYLFAVFEQGVRKFRAEMELQGKTLADLEEVVKTEGDAWAITYGYKPGKEGFKEFHLGDADKIAKRIGIKLGTPKADQKYLLLVESSGPLPKPVLKRPIRRAQ